MITIKNIIKYLWYSKNAQLRNLHFFQEYCTISYLIEIRTKWELKLFFSIVLPIYVGSLQ